MIDSYKLSTPASVVSSLFFHFRSCVVPVGTTVGGFAFGPKEHPMRVSVEAFVVGDGGDFGFCMLWDFGLLLRPHTCPNLLIFFIF